MYYLWHLPIQDYLENEWDEMIPFHSEEEAVEWINKQPVSSRDQYRIKHWPSEAWRYLQREKFETRQVTPPLWQDEPWYKERIEDIGAYACVDPNDTSLLSYFPTPAKGAKGQAQSAKPGVFLKKFFGDILTDKDIKRLTDRHRETFGSVAELKWARTPEEIVKVYTQQAGFTSCMQYPANRFRHGHPVQVYGAGDLAVAYIEQGELLLARAVVWEAKKKVGRVYGDGALLRKALKEYGIPTESSNSKFDNMYGARLLYKPLPDNAVMAPYVDCLDGVQADVEDGYLVLKDNKGPTAQYVLYYDCGISPSREKCECCTGWSGSPYRAYVESAPLTASLYCTPCIQTFCFEAFESNYFRKDKFTQSKGVYREWSWSRGAHIDRPIIVCEERPPVAFFKSGYSGVWYQNTYKIQMHDGSLWDRKEFEKHGAKSWFDGHNYPIKDLQLIGNRWGTPEQVRNYNPTYLFPSPLPYQRGSDSLGYVGGMVTIAGPFSEAA
jgi:hypothetical protein